jgi:antitoxin VapB
MRRIRWFPVPCGRSAIWLYTIDILRVRLHDNRKAFLIGAVASGSTSERLPFPGEEVRIRRHGGAVILEPMTEDWSWLDAIASKLDNDFVEAAKDQPEQQERPAVDEFFR